MNPTTTFILNRILSRFNLEWTDVGLRYIHRLRFGEMSYHVTNDFTKVVEFLGLPVEPTDDINKLYHCIINSNYYSLKLFPRVHGADKVYEQFAHRLKNSNTVSKSIPNITIKDIDKFFGTKISQSVEILNSKGLNHKEIRNKFNGKLVMKWAEIGPGPHLADIMDEFKQYIKDLLWVDFMEYLSTRKPKSIRADFLSYYYEMDYLLTDKSLPF